MDIKTLKEQLEKLEFSPESKEIINQIFDQAINRGFLTQEEKDKLLSIVDMEMVAANIEAETFEEMASALDSFTQELENSEDVVTDNIQSISDNLDEEVGQENI